MDFDMVTTISVIVAVIGILWASVLVHECGHYLAGRTVGVPGHCMQVRLENPPHVALKARQGPSGVGASPRQPGQVTSTFGSASLDSDDGMPPWLSPDHPGYIDAFMSHNPSSRAAWWFVAGGFVVETAVVVMVAGLLSGFGTWPVVVLGASTGLLVAYLIGDVVLSAWRKRPYGDVAVMWVLAPSLTVVMILMVLALRVLVLLLILA